MCSTSKDNTYAKSEILNQFNLKSEKIRKLKVFQKFSTKFNRTITNKVLINDYKTI